jgi:hypothetical protein
LDQVRLKPLDGLKSIVVKRRSPDLVLSQLKRLQAVCERSERQSKNGVVILSTDEEFLVDYLGKEAFHFKAFTASVDSEICSEVPWKSDRPESPAYLICGVGPSGQECTRELLLEHYSVHFAFSTDGPGELDQFDSVVRRYVADAVCVSASNK